MKLIYVLSLGHSGSTLLDCILGTHPQIQSSGELHYINWQLKRTENEKSSLADENICTCNSDFRDCVYWSQVFTKLKDTSGIDIVAEPEAFDKAYFGRFSYNERGGYRQGFQDKLKGYLFRKWLEFGLPLDSIDWLEPRVHTWIKHNWKLYEVMSEVSGKPFIVDSTKNPLIALLLQQYRPKNVHIIFVHRSVEGLVSSSKRWSQKRNKPYSINNVVRLKKKFDHRVKKYITKIKNLSYTEVVYEDFVQNPASFLERLTKDLGANQNFTRQSNSSFYVDPSQQHMVAGNPMRYRGKQQVKYDDRWRKELSIEELQLIRRLYKS